MEPAAVTVRPVQASDRDEWAQLYRGYRAFYRLEPDEDVLDRVWSWLGTPEHEVAGLVAVDGHGRVLGLAHFRKFARPSSGSVGLYLDDLFTSAQERGRGVGRALITRLAEIGRAEGCSVVRWITAADNETAQRLYDDLAVKTQWLTYDLAL